MAAVDNHSAHAMDGSGLAGGRKIGASEKGGWLGRRCWRRPAGARPAPATRSAFNVRCLLSTTTTWCTSCSLDIGKMVSTRHGCEERLLYRLTI
jgi:hypothetical protein